MPRTRLDARSGLPYWQGADADMKLVLASSSPRRRTLLAEAGLSFTVVVPEVEETHRPHEKPEAYVVRNAREKALWVARRPGVGEAVVLGADTVVVQDQHMLEKPVDNDHARSMLMQLSGRRHQVLTGVCLLRIGGPRPADLSFAETTDVYFRELSEAEIDRYVATGEPADKAGAYAIQGGAAGMVERIEGSYTNVVGLPIEAVRAGLARL